MGYRDESEHFVVKVDVLEAGKMGKDLSAFDKGHILMAGRLSQSFSKTAALVGCSRSAVVSTRAIEKWLFYVSGQYLLSTHCFLSTTHLPADGAVGQHPDSSDLFCYKVLLVLMCFSTQ